MSFLQSPTSLRRLLSFVITLVTMYVALVLFDNNNKVAIFATAQSTSTTLLSFGDNLVINGGAENNTDDWTMDEGAITYRSYADMLLSGWIEHILPPVATRGKNAFINYASYQATATQTIDFEAFSSRIDTASITTAIDNREVSLHASAYFGGWDYHLDIQWIEIHFLSSTSSSSTSSTTAPLALLQLAPLTADERSGQTRFDILRINQTFVPPETRALRVQMKFIAASHPNAAPIDSIDITLRRHPSPSAALAVTPSPLPPALAKYMPPSDPNELNKLLNASVGSFPLPAINGPRSSYTTPLALSFVQTISTKGSRGLDISPDGRYAAVADDWAGGIKIIDVRKEAIEYAGNPQDLVILTTDSLLGGEGCGVLFSRKAENEGRILFCNLGRGGLKIIKIPIVFPQQPSADGGTSSTPPPVRKLSSSDVETLEAWTADELGGSGLYRLLLIHNETVLFVGHENGVRVIDVSNLRRTRTIKNFRISGGTKECRENRRKQYVYCANRKSGMTVFNTSDPFNISVVETLWSSYGFSSIDFDEDRKMLATTDSDYSELFVFYDTKPLDDPDHCFNNISKTLTDCAFDVERLSGTVTRPDAVSIFKPQNRILSSSFSSPVANDNNVCQIIVGGGYGVHLTDCSLLVSKGFLKTNGATSAVGPDAILWHPIFPSPTVALVADYTGGFRIVNVQPLSRLVTNQLLNAGPNEVLMGYSLEVTWNHEDVLYSTGYRDGPEVTYVSIGPDGMQAVNTTSPSSPKRLDYTITWGSSGQSSSTVVRPVDPVNGRIAYVAQNSGNTGPRIVNVTDPRNFHLFPDSEQWGGIGYGNNVILDESANTLIFCASTAGYFFFNVTTPTQQLSPEFFYGSEEHCEKMRRQDNILYFTTRGGSKGCWVVVVDISNISRPVRLRQIRPSDDVSDGNCVYSACPSPSNTFLGVVGATTLAGAGANVYAVDLRFPDLYPNGRWVRDASVYSLPYECEFTADGTAMLINDYDAGLKLVDIFDLESPLFTFNLKLSQRLAIDTKGQSRASKFKGRFLYAPDATEGLVVLRAQSRLVALPSVRGSSDMFDERCILRVAVTNVGSVSFFTPTGFDIRLTSLFGANFLTIRNIQMVTTFWDGGQEFSAVPYWFTFNLGTASFSGVPSKEFSGKKMTFQLSVDYDASTGYFETNTDTIWFSLYILPSLLFDELTRPPAPFMTNPLVLASLSTLLADHHPLFKYVLLTSPSSLVSLKIIVSDPSLGSFISTDDFGSVSVSYNRQTGTLNGLGTLVDANVMLEKIRFSISKPSLVSSTTFTLTVDDTRNVPQTLDNLKVTSFVINQPPTVRKYHNSSTNSSHNNTNNNNSNSSNDNGNGKIPTLFRIKQGNVFAFELNMRDIFYDPDDTQGLTYTVAAIVSKLPSSSSPSNDNSSDNTSSSADNKEQEQLGALPLWIQYLFIPSSATITFSGQQNSRAGCDVVITASDGFHSARFTFQVQVQPNLAPRVGASDQSVTWFIKEESSFGPLYDFFADPDNDTLVLNALLQEGDPSTTPLKNLPAFMSFAPSTGVLTGNPVEADLGEYTVFFSATDKFGQTTNFTADILVTRSSWEWFLLVLEILGIAASILGPLIAVYETRILIINMLNGKNHLLQRWMFDENGVFKMPYDDINEVQAFTIKKIGVIPEGEEDSKTARFLAWIEHFVANILFSVSVFLYNNKLLEPLPNKLMLPPWIEYKPVAQELTLDEKKADPDDPNVVLRVQDRKGRVHCYIYIDRISKKQFDDMKEKWLKNKDEKKQQGDDSSQNTNVMEDNNKLISDMNDGDNDDEFLLDAGIYNDKYFEDDNNRYFVPNEPYIPNASHQPRQHGPKKLRKLADKISMVVSEKSKTNLKQIDYEKFDAERIFANSLSFAGGGANSPLLAPLAASSLVNSGSSTTVSKKNNNKFVPPIVPVVDIDDDQELQEIKTVSNNYNNNTDNIDSNMKQKETTNATEVSDDVSSFSPRSEGDQSSKKHEDF